MKMVMYHIITIIKYNYCDFIVYNVWEYLLISFVYSCLKLNVEG